MSGEPISTAAGAAAGWKLIGGAAGALGFGATLASIVVMLKTRPKTDAEWAVGIISTVVGSLAGGAFVVLHWELQELMFSFLGLMTIFGMAFSCGLPAWALVRCIFRYIDKLDDKNATIVDAINDVKKIV